MEILVSTHTPLAIVCESLIIAMRHGRIIEMQVFIAELFGDFQVALPSEEVVIKRAPAGIIMLPVVAGKEDELSVAMPLRLSLVQP